MPIIDLDTIVQPIQKVQVHRCTCTPQPKGLDVVSCWKCKSKVTTDQYLREDIDRCARGL